MKYINKTLDFQLNSSSAVTLGKFDGLHRGHMKLINRVLEIGESGLETVIFAFNVQTLLTNEERKDMVLATAIDYFIECPFVPEIMNMEPETFVEEVLVKQLRVAHVVVGMDFHFGHKRKGTPQMLVELGEQHGFKVEVLEKIYDDKREISSTYIREEIEKGNIKKANELLGYPYFITGEIIEGRKLGRTIGIPTINQAPALAKQLLPFGVYTSQTEVGGEKYKSVTNIGIKPTVNGDKVGIETNLFDCNEELYGKVAKVEFYDFQRPEQKFASIEELKIQLEKDIKQAKEFSF